MLLFQNKRDALTPIESDSFKLERDIQSLVEKNIDTLFGLKFVSSEFTVADFRLDSLAFDEQSQSFVIIEYKKGSSYSVVDQGYSYLSTMLNNKADFILEYNEKTDKQLKKANVDWASSRVIFISPSFNTHQKNSINFKDIPFELWEIKKFDGGLIAVEQCKSSSNESIEKLSKGNAGSVISKVSSEVKVLSEEYHTDSIDENTKYLWATLRRIFEDYSDTSFSVTKSYVSWKRNDTNKIVCTILFRKNQIHVDFYRGNKKATGEKSRGFFTIDDPKGLAKNRNWTWQSGDTGHGYRMSVKKLEDMDYLMFLLKQKYNSLD